jgi:hypothetical protein
MFRIALNKGHLAILDSYINATTTGTHVAGGRFNLSLGCLACCHLNAYPVVLKNDT